MLTTLLALLTLVQPASQAPPAPPAPLSPPAPSAAAPVRAAAVGQIIPEAQAIFDRATAAYRSAKGYREVTQITMSQKASNLMPEAEPPADQASTTHFVWAGPDRFAFHTRDISVYQEGADAVVNIKALGQYTRRPPQQADRNVFANMIDMHPIYGIMTSPEDLSDKPFPRVISITKVQNETLRGQAGKRLTGTGLPPLPGLEVACPVTLWFDDSTGLLRQWSFDMKGVIQQQLDRTRAMSGSTTPRPIIEKFSVTADWLEAAISQAAPEAVDADPLLAFTPSQTDNKVEDFNLSDGEDSVQNATIGKPAPDFKATTLDGKSVTLSELRGKVVLLHVWSSSNAPSVTSLSPYNSMHLHYTQSSKGSVEVLGICQDHPSMIQQTRAIIARKGATYPMLADPEKQISNALRVSLLPNTILIDKEGIVRSITTEFDPADQVLLSQEIDRLMKGESLRGLEKPGLPGTPVKVIPGASPAPAPKP